MERYLISSLVMALIVSISCLNTSKLNHDIVKTMQEMQRASYFTFVTLLSMVQDGIPSNTTFLMPSDRALSKASIPVNRTLEFLLRHSIRSPLLFNDLSRFPTGTTIPTYQQDYVLEIVNRGKRDLYLNNVLLVNRDICTAASSFKCHGIYGVLAERTSEPAATCSHVNPTERAAGPAPAPSLPQTLSPPLAGSPSLIPEISPSPVESNDGSRKSSSSARICQGLFTTTVISMVLFVSHLPF